MRPKKPPLPGRSEDRAPRPHAGGGQKMVFGTLVGKARSGGGAVPAAGAPTDAILSLAPAVAPAPIHLASPSALRGRRGGAFPVGKPTALSCDNSPAAPGQAGTAPLVGKPAALLTSNSASHAAGQVGKHTAPLGRDNVRGQTGTHSVLLGCDNASGAPSTLSAEGDGAFLGRDGGSRPVGRAGRLLRDARAAVQAPRPFRPDTPLELLTRATRPNAARGARLPSLPRYPEHASPTAPVPPKQKFHPDRLLVGFQQAVEDPEDGVKRQVALLRELAMWLANPLHKIREEWVQALTLRLELYNEQEQLNEGDLSVIVAMISILLRNTTPQTCPALPTITLLLKCMAEGGMSAWIEREILFEPLFHLLEDESLLRREPKTLLRIVETFLCATAVDTKENAGGSPLEGIQQGSTASISSRLVGLGITPVLNTLLQRLLNLEAASADEEADSTFVRHSIMSAVCGIYRNLSVGYAHHLREVGTVELLLAVLEAMAAYTVIVAAASRALVKFVFDVDSLRALRGNNRVISAAATALAQQISLRKTKQSIRTEDREQGEESEASYLLLLVSRLCSVIGLVVQGSPSHREYLVQHHTSLLEELVNQFVANTPHRPPLPGASSPISDGGEQGEMTVVQGAVWLVGVAATSPHCNLEFVMRVAAMLVRYLTELEFTPATRLNAIYVLMCISNLSCHFHRMEDDNKSSDELLELFNTLGPILAGFLFEGDAEATVEATRVLGNVSYTSAGRDWMEANRCDEVVVIFAGHEDLRIVYNCFGILLNLTAGTRCRVVEDPQLLKMLLQHTDRYTRRDDIDKAASEEGSRLRQTQGAEGGLHRIHNLTPLSPRDLKDAGSSATSIDAPEALAKDYAEQTADLVEKLLMNVKGLVLCAADEEAEESEEES